MRHEYIGGLIGLSCALDHFAGELLLGADGFGGGDVGEVPGAVGFEDAAAGGVGEMNFEDVLQAFACLPVFDGGEELDAL